MMMMMVVIVLVEVFVNVLQVIGMAGGKPATHGEMWGEGGGGWCSPHGIKEEGEEYSINTETDNQLNYAIKLLIG